MKLYQFIPLPLKTTETIKQNFDECACIIKLVKNAGVYATERLNHQSLIQYKRVLRLQVTLKIIL